jgi:hypothetical protein
MTYEITSTETGRTFTFASQDAYEAAEAWYNDTNGEEIQNFCKRHGLDLSVSATKLRSDWHDAAMELYARVHRQ